MKPRESKITALRKGDHQDLQGIHSYQSMIKYLTRFIPDFITLT